MQVAISGAHGLIGGALAAALEADGHEVRRMIRSETAVPPDAIRWDPAESTIDLAALEGLDAVVHLAGAGIGDHRWTEEHKRVVRESRIKGTDLIARSLAELNQPPPVFVCGSAIGYYGDRGDTVLTEKSPPGSGFLADLVVAWEKSAAPATNAGIRTVITRTAPVFTRSGGALAKMLLLFRLGLGGPFGSGRQWMSWITLADEVAALRFLIERDDIAGPVNLTAPDPVTNKDFARALGRALHRPALLPVPKFGPSLILGRQGAEEMLYYSQRIQPTVLSEAGFPFAHPDLPSALEALLHD
jgi:uncharacterized protein (TIGR01777 family)